MLWHVLLSLIPPAAITTMYWYATKDNTIKALRQHPAALHADWLFTPFNLLLLETVQLRTGQILLATVTAAMVCFGATIAYQREHKNNLDTNAMFTHTGDLTPVGVVHALFATIQTTLVTYFLLFATASVTAVMASIILLMYFTLFSFKATRKKRELTTTDITFVTAGSLAVALRFATFLV